MYFSKLLIVDLIEFATGKGVDIHDLCRRIGIDMAEAIDPRQQVSYEKMVEVLTITRETIKDNFLGLHLGEQMVLKGKRQVDDIMLNSSTIAEAFRNGVNYSKLISDALTSSMEKTGNYTKVSFVVNPDWTVHQNHAVQQIIDMTLTCTLKSICWLTGEKHRAVAVHLNYPSLKKKNEYYRVFDCPIKFNEPIPCIIFQNTLLHQKVRAPDVGLLASLKHAADIEIKKIQSAPPLIIAIKKIVLDKLPTRLTLAEVASELHFSSRTLQRKLFELTTNFKKIEKEIILQLGKKMILYEDRNLAEISYLLGFSEASAFIRFFKNEVALTPKKYRKMASAN